MTRLPSVKPRDVLPVLNKIGFSEDRQRGSHKVLVRAKDNKTVVLPWHSKDLKRGTLRGIIKSAGITVEEFVSYL